MHLLNRGAAREAKRGEGTPRVVEPEPTRASDVHRQFGRNRHAQTVDVGIAVSGDEERRFAVYDRWTAMDICSTMVASGAFVISRWGTGASARGLLRPSGLTAI
jgi:hypothetical protein